MIRSKFIIPSVALALILLSLPQLSPAQGLGAGFYCQQTTIYSKGRPIEFKSAAARVNASIKSLKKKLAAAKKAKKKAAVAKLKNKIAELKSIIGQLTICTQGGFVNGDAAVLALARDISGTYQGLAHLVLTPGFPDLPDAPFTLNLTLLGSTLMGRIEFGFPASTYVTPFDFSLNLAGTTLPLVVPLTPPYSGTVTVQQGGTFSVDAALDGTVTSLKLNGKFVGRNVYGTIDGSGAGLTALGQFSADKPL
jgi:hypothetical protein